MSDTGLTLPTGPPPPEDFLSRASAGRPETGKLTADGRIVVHPETPEAKDG